MCMHAAVSVGGGGVVQVPVSPVSSVNFRYNKVEIMGEEILAQASGTYSLDVVEYKFSKRDPALSQCCLGKFLG